MKKARCRICGKAIYWVARQSVWRHSDSKVSHGPIPDPATVVER